MPSLLGGGGGGFGYKPPVKQPYNVLGGGGGAPNSPAGMFGGMFGGMPGMSQGPAQAAAATPRSAIQPAQPSAQFSMPQYQGGNIQGLQQMQQFGQGMMQPGSDYYQRLSEAMQQQIGGQAAAGQRAAALRGAWSGFGGGASPESMQTAADIGQAGLEAAGQAQAGLALQGPQLGMQALQSTFAPQLGQQQLGEQARQFGVGAGLQQQQLAAQQAYQQAQMQQQAQLAQQQQAMQQQQMMMQLMASMFGGY